MVKLVYCISRRPELEPEEFRRYWREVHAPIAGKIPGLRRYVQCHTVERSAELRADFDGAAELWFDDMDALLTALASPEVEAAVSDERNFIDHGRTAMFVTEEHEIV